MAINERLVHTASAAAGAGSGNQEEGLILHLDANDVDSYDGDGSVWYDITNHEYKPATNVSEHFNTVAYSGASSSQSITGVGFQPDMVWIKSRNLANNHVLIDSVRGLNGGSTFENLYSNLTNAQANDNAVSSLDSDGFSLVNSEQNANHSSYTYVAWCFKAGGAAVSNTDGDTTSQVSANQDLGFSIVEHTGTGSNTSIGHGLGIAPELIITKNTTDVSNWSVSGSVGGLVYGTNKLQLNTTAAIASDSNEVLSANGTTFTVGSSGATNGSGDSNIHYCFASKRGVSKVGSFIGTGAAGNKVYTGFEPAFILMKRSSSSGSGWYIIDNKRSTDSDKNDYLSAETNGAEATSSSGITFDRDGFTFNGGSFNTSGQTHIYYAVAKDTNETELNSNSDLFLHYDPADTNSYSGTGTTLTDLVGNNNADLLGGIESGWDEELGNSFPITGSGDGITTSSTVSINPATDGMTIEMWVKVKTDVQNYLFSFDGTNTTGFGLSYRTNVDKIAWFYRNTSGSNSVIYSDTIVLNEWTHIVATTDGSSAQFYTNGVLSEETSSSAYSYTYNEDLHFGNYFDLNQNSNSDVGQIRFYKGQLTADEVMQNFNFTKNDYPNGYNGTISGATWNSGGYFDFDGSDDIVETQLMTKANTLRSYSFWFRTSSTSAQVIFDGNNSGSTSAWHHLYIDNTELSLRLSGVASAAANDNTNYCDGVWRHCVAICNTPTFKKLYINGTETASSTSFSTPTGSLVGLDIGHYQNTGGLHFNGDISQFKAYDKVLTTSEISTLFDNDKADYGY